MPLSSASPIATVSAFVACTLIWGSTFLFISIGNETVPPVWGATLRLVVAAIVLTPIALLRRHGLPRGAAWRAAVLLGFFQFGLGFPLLYWGQTRVPSGLAAVLYATIPLSSALLARAFGLERVTPAKIAGALLALAGIVVIFSSELQVTATPLPLAAILLATICGVLGTLFYKKGPRQSAIGANAVGAAVASAVCLGLSLGAGEPRQIPATWDAIYPILYLALAGSVGAFVLFAWLVKHWDVTRVSYIAVVSPLVALVLGVVVRHERITGLALLGSLVVLAGVAIGVARRPAG